MENSFAKRLEKALRIRNVKQSELVERTQISKSAISQYLSGAFEPKQKNIYKIAKALDVNPVWLMGNEIKIAKIKWGQGIVLLTFLDIV